MLMSNDTSYSGEELTPDDLKFIEDRTKFSQNTIKKWFKKFRVECPNGRLFRFTHLVPERN